MFTISCFLLHYGHSATWPVRFAPSVKAFKVVDLEHIVLQALVKGLQSKLDPLHLCFFKCLSWVLASSQWCATFRALRCSGAWVIVRLISSHRLVAPLWLSGSPGSVSEMRSSMTCASRFDRIWRCWLYVEALLEADDATSCKVKVDVLDTCLFVLG